MLTPKEFAAELGVHVNTVYRWIRHQNIIAVQIVTGGAIRIRRAEIARARQAMTERDAMR